MNKTMLQAIRMRAMGMLVTSKLHDHAECQERFFRTAELNKMSFVFQAENKQTNKNKLTKCIK